MRLAQGELWTVLWILALSSCGPSRDMFDSGEQIPRVPISSHDELVSQYRVDPTHRGVAPRGASMGTAPELKWKSDVFAVGDYSASKSSPAVDTDLVYVGVDDGRLLALERDDGSLRWSFATRRHGYESEYPLWDHRGIHGTPAFDEERVYIGDYSGWLYAVDKASGTLIWEVELGDSIGASPVLYGGHVFISVEFGDPDGQVFVVRADTGETVYVTEGLGDNPHGSVSIDPDRGFMFVGANSERFYCFDFVNKREVWRFDVDGEIKSTAAVMDELVYVTSWDRHLYAIDIETGDLRFELETQDKSMSSPSVYDGSVYFGSNDGRLYALDAIRGDLRWSFDANGRITSSPTVTMEPPTVTFGTTTGNVFMLDAKDGQLIWEHRVSSGFTSVPVVVGESLFLNDDTGTVWRFDRSD